MRIIFHQRAVAGNRGGVGVYATQLLEGLRAQRGDHEVDCFPDGWLWDAYKTWAHLQPWSSQLELESETPGLGKRSWLTPVKAVPRAALAFCRYSGRGLLDRQCRSVFLGGHYDLYHEPNLVPLEAEIPTVVTLHDLSILLHPQWHPLDRVHWFERHFHRRLQQCQHFITVSKTIRREVIRVLGIPPARVTAIYHGVTPHFAPIRPEAFVEVLGQLALRPGYLLYLGTIEPRKNILMLLQAYCALPQALRDRCPLVLAGSWGWGYREVADFYEREARHRGVRHLGYLSEHYLPAIYNGARALVYPSFYEGFGLPCLEMMACGGAVLGSTAEVFQETIGGQAYLVPADDTSGWREAMRRVIEDEDWYRLLRQGSARLARRYTWESCASKTLDVYRAVCGVGSVWKSSEEAAA